MDLPRYNDQHPFGDAGTWKPRSAARSHWLIENQLWLTDYRGRMEMHFFIQAVPTRADLGYCDAPSESKARAAIASEMFYRTRRRGGYKVVKAGPSIAHGIAPDEASVILY